MKVNTNYENKLEMITLSDLKHMEIAKTWNTSEGARVVEKWKKAVGK